SKAMGSPTSSRYVTARHTAIRNQRRCVQSSAVTGVGMGFLPLPLPLCRGINADSRRLSPANDGASDHIPPNLVVAPRASHNTLDLSMRYPHHVFLRANGI